MEAATHERRHEHEVTEKKDGELATLYGGLGDQPAPYPMLVQPWEEESWDPGSAVDAEIFAGLLRLSP